MLNREPISSIKSGPQRCVYGKTASDEIILPLDFVLYELDATSDVIIQKLRNIPEIGSTVGADVKTLWGSPFGNIKSYASPSVIGSVNPVVLVNPTIKSSQVKKIPDVKKIADHNDLKDGDQVSIEYIDSTLSLIPSGVDGQLNIIGNAIKSAIFLTPILNVDAYLVTFNSNLQENSRGARVVLKSTGELVGMLIFTSNSGGVCNALVYPAHLIS
ncbi:hypothetical protein [Pseudanabaena mucicola]|uniref:Uncharacterized protein n=1 Tax=Pseudanabaena mucicola FACHB-723 TaxID=2692860 RepID=A0ABR7ZSY0_9CYAN|nr:hypothetical protein [Pseudanabaena mucicola]MBD2186627.1 hypothetical protein [Pseudanabaena mucicola FACHB-723]